MIFSSILNSIHRNRCRSLCTTINDQNCCHAFGGLSHLVKTIKYLWLRKRQFLLTGSTEIACNIKLKSISDRSELRTRNSFHFLISPHSSMKMQSVTQTDSHFGSAFSFYSALSCAHTHTHTHRIHTPHIHTPHTTPDRLQKQQQQPETDQT